MAILKPQGPARAKARHTTGNGIGVTIIKTQLVYLNLVPNCAINEDRLSLPILRKGTKTIHSAPNRLLLQKTIAREK